MKCVARTRNGGAGRHQIPRWMFTSRDRVPHFKRGRRSRYLARMGEAEWRRVVDLRAVVTTEEALSLIHAVIAVAKGAVKDPETLRLVQELLPIMDQAASL
jgi:hypothetical protein